MKTSELFKLNPGDIARGIVTAVLTGAALAVVGIVNTVGFDIFSADWNLIGHLAANGAFSGFIGYIVKNFLTTSDGKVLGFIG